MKFGKQIQIQQITEWQNHYMSYKGLKKIINSLIQEKAQTSVTIAASPPPGSAPPPPPEDDYSKFLQSQKAAFFFKLERELEKVNSFYLQKETELKVRLRSLIDKEKVLMSRQGRPGSSSSINSLKEAYRQFEQDLNKLQKFVETNGTGFRKILKKWDKRSKSSTKELYLSRQVELQPCFNQDAMVELADLAAYHLLGLENIQQANNNRSSSNPPSPVSTKPPQGLPFHHPSSPVQQQMDELETDLFNAMISNQASLVQEILGRRLIAPSPLQGAGVSVLDASGSSSAASAGGAGNGGNTNSNQIGPENAREVVSRVFWRCCSESAVQEHVIQSLVATGLVNFRFVDDINDRTCLHEAAMAGRLSLMKLCVENGVNPDCVDVYGRRPLHYVSLYGHAECATYLLSLQVSMSAADHDGFKPLIYSVMNGHSACVEIFLAHGVEIEAAQEGDPIPLSLACHYGHEDIAMRLIERGANIHASNADGLEPLHITCREGHTRLVEILTARGARLDQEDKYMCWTPLFYAASEGHVDCVKILLAAGCNVNVLDELAKTPIYYAASEGHADCVELLVEAGGKIEGGSKVGGSSSSSAAPFGHEDTDMESVSLGVSLATAKPTAGAGSIQSELSLGPSAFDTKGMDDLDMDCIPSLSLPPPIIPFRIYGHNYLDKKHQVNLVLGHPSFPQHKLIDGKMISSHQAPVHLYGTAQISSLKLIISSRPDNGMIPHNVILPLGDEREVFGFQVDSLEHFTVEFDIYPTFGSKAIGRAVALPSMFNSPMESSVGRGTLPLFDAHLKVVGELSFEYSVIRPFEGVRLEVGGRVETYWKSTNSIDSSISTATTPVVGTPSTMPLSTSNSSGVLPHPGGSTSALVGNMIPSFITASSLSGEYVQLSVQMTRDLVPVVYAGWYLPVNGFDLALSDVTFQQFKRFGEILHQRALNEELEGVSTRLANSWTSGEWRQKVYERWMSLEQVLKILPKHVGVNLELKYPTLSERSFYRLTNAADMNKFVDTILQTVYDCSATHHRSVMFSSFNPMICSALNWKQPNYAVFFSTYCGYNKVRRPASSVAALSNISSEEEAASKKRKEPTAVGASQLEDSLPSPKQIITSAVPLSEVNSRGQSTNIIRPVSSLSSLSAPLAQATIASSSSTASDHGAGINHAAASTSNNTTCEKTKNKSDGAADEEQQKWFHEDDRRCTSIKEAVKFARGNNLLGVICEATPLIQVPSLITHIKESGLILTSFGVGNKDPALVQLQRNHGVDAFMIMDDAESSAQAAQASVGSSTLNSPMTSAPSPKSGVVGATGLGVSLMSTMSGGGGGAASSSSMAWTDRRSGGGHGAAEIEKGVLRYNGVDSASSFTL
ncbi:phosphate system positive regulatory protein pho81 [Actinomortierella ambigua]|uniref:Phosphate system positive regulatory protein pho81 n=1 Tax=Actinomortierella ambigua TaxID=1343610 RepID=A0A9P6PYI3_9FUNG|nr:phosphate system positive regulatory protein pho81 [Actinomortierella ambigua]